MNISKLPIKELSIQIDSSLLEPNCIGIDFGTERTKLAYPSACIDSESTKKYTANFATFETYEKTGAEVLIKYLTDKLPDLKSDSSSGRKNWKVRVTGARATQAAADSIKQQLGLEISFVDEASSQCRGASFLMTRCDSADTAYPAPFIDPAEFAGLEHGETFKKFNEAQVDLMSGDSKFPCLLGVFGSICRVFLLQEDGRGEEVHTQNLSGKSFLGICQLFTGVSDYSALMSMAAAGKRGNIDSQIRDLLADMKNSPYGRLPPSLAVFPFGKAVDNDKSFEDTRPQDLVHSLVATFTSNLIYTVTQMALFYRARSIRFAGGFFNHECPRAELIKTGKLFTAIDSMDVEFFKIDQIAALGAMLREIST
uniref:Ppx-GppA domain-containing protein n=1 Tax=Macrostomum lignano TaxID=282301 RepID=A0A1I8H4T5_9PLAT